MRNLPSLIAVASLATLVTISSSIVGNAASVTQRTNVSYASSAPQMSRGQQQEPVPANCIRQECGKLWCWQMKGSNGH